MRALPEPSVQVRFALLISRAIGLAVAPVPFAVTPATYLPALARIAVLPSPRHVMPNKDRSKLGVDEDGDEFGTLAVRLIPSGGTTRCCTRQRVLFFHSACRKALGGGRCPASKHLCR